MNPDIERAHRHYMESHFGDISDLENYGETMYRAGARSAVENMVSFSNVVPLVGRVQSQVQGLVDLLESFRVETVA